MTPSGGQSGELGPPRQATEPPRSGAGVGVGTLRGAGDSLTGVLENKKGFMALWLDGFIVVWFHDFMVLWFCILWLYGFKKYQMSISCFQEDIDHISMVSRFY